MSEQSKEDIIVSKLRNILQETLVEEVDWDSFSAQTTIESLGLDSLTILDLLYDIEQDTGVHVEAKDVVRFRTIGDIASLLIEKGA